MSKESMLEMNALVVDVLPSTQFKVQLLDENFKPINDNPIRAILSGKMRQSYNIRSNRILENDLVIVEISPYDMNVARIRKRIYKRHIIGNTEQPRDENVEKLDNSSSSDNLQL